MFVSTSHKPSELAGDIFKVGYGTGKDMLPAVYHGVHCGVTFASSESPLLILQKSYLKTHLWHVFIATRYLRPSISNLEISVRLGLSSFTHRTLPNIVLM